MLHELPSEKYLVLGIVYMGLELWLGNKTKYRLVTLTFLIFAILFAISIFSVVLLKLKEKICQNKN